MAITIATSGTFTFADGNGGHVCDLGSAPAVGQIDVLCVNSNTTVSTPSGFTLDETAVTNQGAYIFRRKAAGSEGSTVTITTSGNHHTQVGWSRWNGADALDISTSTQVNSSTAGSTPAHSTGTLAETGEAVIAFGALHSIGVADQHTPVWSTGFTGLTAATQGSGGTGVVGYVGYKLNAGTTAETPSVSWSGAGAFNRYMLTISLTAADELTGELDATLPMLTAESSAEVGEAVATGGNWNTLLDIWREARELAAEERSRPPVACPLCGEPLVTGRNGQLRCPADGWTWGR